VAVNITANNTTQATATALTSVQNYVSTVGVNGAVKIPAAGMIVGTKYWIINEQTVNELFLFGDTGVVINAQAANTSVGIPSAAGPNTPQTTIVLVKDATHLSTI
jgi:hypothetical protein